MHAASPEAAYTEAAPPDLDPERRETELESAASQWRPVRAFITRVAERFSSSDPPASTARAHAFRQLALNEWKAENPSAIDVGAALRNDIETYTASARESGLTVPQLINTVVAVFLFALQAKNTELQVEIDAMQGQVETDARAARATTAKRDARQATIEALHARIERMQANRERRMDTGDAPQPQAETEKALQSAVAAQAVAGSKVKPKSKKAGSTTRSKPRAQGSATAKDQASQLKRASRPGL